MTDDSYKAAVVGTNQYGFVVPDGLRWHQGQLYVADEGGSAVEVFSQENQLAKLCDANAGIMSPEDLVVDENGDIYFTDDDAGGLWKIDAGGKTSVLAGKDQGLFSTEGIALTPEGKILVGETRQHEIFSVSKDGTVSVFLGPEYRIKKAESMAFDEAGNLYIADNQDDILYLLDTNRALHRLIERDEKFSPESIVYAQGALYLTDSKHAKLCRFSPKDGLKTIAVFGGKLQNVQGITVDERGSIYVSIQSDLIEKVGYLIKLSKD